MQTLDAATVRLWSRLAVQTLDAARAQLDAANLFPVADHDTGTNIAATVRAAADELAAASIDSVATLAPALRCLATGAVRGARGNSGVIVSQVLRGFADAAADRGGAAESHRPSADGWDGADLARGLARAARAARQAVVTPVEGTILTVADAAATAARTVTTGTAGPVGSADPVGQSDVARGSGSDDSTALSDVLARVVDRAREALNQTVTALPVHAAAGVGDAGAHGLVLLYEALLHAVNGEPLAPTEPDPAPVTPVHLGSLGGPAYEVQYLLELPAGADPAAVTDRLAAALSPLGDCLVLAGDGAGLWSVHVHVDDVGAAIEAGASASAGGGAMSAVRVTRFADAVLSGVSAPAAAIDASTGPGAGPGPGRRGLVMCGTDHRVPAHAVFDPLGVDVVAPDAEVAPGELVVVALGTDAVRAAVGLGDQRPGITVVPARSLVQAMAAVAVHDPARRAVDDTVAMAEAAAACRYGRLTVATDDGLTIVGRCRAGDVLGEVGDDIAVIGTAATEVAVRVLDALLGAGGELVTVLHRPDAADAVAAIERRVRGLGGHVDLDVRAVAAMDSPVLIGVE